MVRAGLRDSHQPGGPWYGGAGGGVTALDSSRANLDADGDAKPLDGNGKASLVSRRRGPGRALVGEDNP